MPATPVDPFGEDLAYVQVADDLRRRIASGELTGRIPSERYLADEYETSVRTVRTAVGRLRSEGLLRTASTRGTFVAPAD